MENFFLDYFHFFFVGAAVGLIGYLFGLGGGIILVPILKFSNFSMHQAISISLIVIVFNASAVAIEKLRNDQIALPVTGWIEASGLLGALFGAYLAQSLGSQILTKVFSVFTLLMTVVIWTRSGKSDSNQQEVGENYLAEPTWKFVSLGGAGGFLSALLGIGAGAMMVPALVSVCRMPFKVAAGTSSYVSAIFAVTGALVLIEHVHWPVMIFIIFGIRVGATLSSKYLSRISSNFLTKLFACLLLIIGIRMWIK